MPTPTDRFGLDTYDPGESWDHTDTVQFLDESAIEVDTIANRPTSGSYDGELFFATDQRILYQWDAGGSSWDVELGLGVDGTPVPGTSHFEALEAETITDGADVDHSDELADAADVSPIQSSSDVVVTDTQVGTLADGEYLLNSGGTLTGATVSGAFGNIQVFETDGTFDASNVGLAYVEVVGGGGGGGGWQDGNNDRSGAGGGAGGYGAGFVDLSGTSSVSVTIGAGGAGGSESDGSAGGSSSFGSFISATGGGGGAAISQSNAAGAGGFGSGGDINAHGDGGDLGDGGIAASGGGGGSSVLGGGARPAAENENGIAGSNYGGGGGGSGQGATVGGDGADGVVIVRY